MEEGAIDLRDPIEALAGPSEERVVGAKDRRELKPVFPLTLLLLLD